MIQRSAIALQTPSGLQFGNVVRVRSDLLTVEIEGVLSERDVVEWRMELSGHQDTVMGSLKVLRVRQQAGGTMRCSCRILHMSARDRARLTAWLSEKRDGGTTRRYDDISEITRTSRAPSTTMTETRAALERMDKKRWYRTSQSTHTEKDVLGLTSEVKSGASRKQGRAALRDALRTSMARKKQRAATTPPPEPTREETTETAALPIRDPEIVRIPHTDPPRVHVRYRDPAVYRKEYQQHLRCSAMFLPLPELGGDGTALDVHIEPPRRLPVRCKAEIKVQMPTGVGVALRLTRTQRERLDPDES